MAYAENTKVSVDKSKAEIENILSRYGATGFMYGWQGDRAIVAFEANKRHVKFLVPMPNKDEKRFTHTPHRGDRRHPDQAHAEWVRAQRQKWRALALAIKAKLECVDSGITTFEQEFLAHIVLPSGQTVSGWFAPQLEAVYESKKMPLLLPGCSK